MINPKSILDIELDNYPEGCKTVKDYLVKLLEALWEDGEGFSGKRPFGNSGWEYDLIDPIMGSMQVTKKDANQMVKTAILSLGW